MSRQKDYQPTIDRQRAQNADLKRIAAEQRVIARNALRDNSHLRFAIQAANDENEDLRLAMLVQDSLVAGLRADLECECEKVDQLQRLVAELSKPTVIPKPFMNPFLGSGWRGAGCRLLAKILVAPSEPA